MDMEKRYKQWIGFALFVANTTLCVGAPGLEIIVSILGSTTMPFITYVIPGALYYMHLLTEDQSSSIMGSGR
jgi:Transmembrane amino acid transporter protein